MPPRFIYFDLGNVILNFDHRLMARQMAGVSGVQEGLVWEVLFEAGLEARYEAGEIDDAGFYAAYCEAVGAMPDVGRDSDFERVDTQSRPPDVFD